MSATSDYFYTLLQQAKRDERKIQVFAGNYSIFGEVLGFEGDDMGKPVVVKVSESYNPDTEASHLAIDRIINVTFTVPAPAPTEPEPTEPPSPDQTGPIQ